MTPGRHSTHSVSKRGLRGDTDDLLRLLIQRQDYTNQLLLLFTYRKRVSLSRLRKPLTDTGNGR